jgi:dihydrofolate reductase
MRKVIYGVGISLDGYIARPDGSVDFLFMPKDYSMGPFFKRVDTAVMGRKTYEVGLKMSGGKTFNGYGLKCYVFSKKQKPGERGGVTFVRAPAKAWLAPLQEQEGKDLWLMGGGELARIFLQDDLVDELYLGVVPTLIGQGIPAFPNGFPQREFALAENKSFSKGLIALRYERVRMRKSKRV